MEKKKLFTVAAILLGILGVIMMVLGIKGSIPPPFITGVGFLVIGFVFWKMKYM